VILTSEVATADHGLLLPRQAALEFLFTLALESAMRLSEMYTLEIKQFDVPKRTAFLERPRMATSARYRLRPWRSKRFKTTAAMCAARREVWKDSSLAASWCFRGGKASEARSRCGAPLGSYHVSSRESLLRQR
jgi:integrase